MKNLILSPVGVLLLFLLGILFNVIFHVQGEGVQRLYALIPSVILMIVWICTSKSGQ